MSQTPIEPDADPSQAAIDPGITDDPGGAAPDPDSVQGQDVDPVQTGEPATGPQAPVPPGGSDDADG
jgi:hypothetical protein